MFSFSKHTSCAIAISSALFAAAALSSCSNPTTLGSDLVDGDNIYGELVVSDANTAETAEFRMNTTTEAEDAIPTYKYIANQEVYMRRFLFGAVNDPVFGKYSSGIYLQPFTDSNKPDAAAVADSVFLILQYDMPVDTTNTSSILTATKNVVRINRFKEANIIGDTLPQQSLTVYQLADDMVNSLPEGYYSDKVFATQSTILATYNYTAQPTSHVTTLGRNWKNTADSTGKTLPHLRIKLDKSLADALFLDKNNLTDNTKLRNIIKGLYIAPSTNNTFLHSFNVLSRTMFAQPTINSPILTPMSGLLIYHHLPSAPSTPLTYRITFEGANSSIATTKFTHNRIGSPVGSALLAGNKKRIGDSVVYVQGMAGTNGKITFPNLGKLKGKVIINKAELTLKAISDGTNFPKPLYLGLAHNLTTGSYQTIGDMIYSGNLVHSGYLPSIIYGGKLNASTYTMNVTIALQNLIDGTLSDLTLNTTDKNLTEKYLYISTLGKLYNAQRVALGGSRNKTYAPVLKVYMTRL
jgi:hypothetical protein